MYTASFEDFTGRFKNMDLSTNRKFSDAEFAEIEGIAFFWTDGQLTVLV
jgi:hypothetical protein